MQVTANLSIQGSITVSDDQVTVTCPAGNLSLNGSLTCNASSTIPQADLAPAM